MIEQNYKVAIKNNETGEIRIGDQKGITWGEHSHYWWTEGNYGCDCNREWEFQRAGDEDTTYNPMCGNTRYTVLYAELDDGSKIYID